MLLPGDSRTNIVRTLSVDGVGELTLVRTERRETHFPWKLAESFEWTGRTGSGAGLSLDSVTSADKDPDAYVLERVNRALMMLSDIRRQAAGLMWDATKGWTQTPPASEEAFADMLELDGVNYLLDTDPSGDMIEICLKDTQNIFGGHAILCDVDSDGRVLSADLVG